MKYFIAALAVAFLATLTSAAQSQDPILPGFSQEKEKKNGKNAKPAQEKKEEKKKAAKKDKKSNVVRLFNGKNLKGWEHFLVKPDAKMEDVWSIKDGILICKGEPMGYLATKRQFKSFKLVVEWRWAPGGKPGNSGVLMRITGKPMMLPNCVEAQLQAGNAGDIYGFQGFKVDGDKARRIEAPDFPGGLVGVKKMAGNEKAPGEWNKYEITLDGDKLTTVVNGKKVNEATGVDVRRGKIGLQSEGGEVHFRTVELTPIRKKSANPK